MNEQLETLENQLGEMHAKKRIAIYVGIIVLLVYLSWNLFGEDMNTEIKTKQSSIASLQEKLQRNSIRSLERAIKNAKRKTLTLKGELTKLHFKKQFVRTKLESIKFIFSNEMGFAKILDNILKNSIAENIDINYIKSIEKNTKKGKHISLKEVFSVNGTGSFQGILNLVHHIDSMNAILNISGLKIYIDDKSNTAFDLNISHYGVEL